MNSDLKFDGYKLARSEDGTYIARVETFDDNPRIEIPEEYNGIPITWVGVYCNLGYTAGTVCVSKNVRFFSNIEAPRRDEIEFPYYCDESWFLKTPYFVEVSPENPWLCSDEKAVFSKDKKILYAFTAKGDTSYVIPDGVEVIFDSAFSVTTCLEEITIPHGIVEIGDLAFTQSHIRNFNIPDSVKKIGQEAFSCTLTTSFTLPKYVEEVGKSAFRRAYCGSPVFLPDCFNKPEYDMPYCNFTDKYIIDENSKAFNVIDGIIYSKDMKALLSITRAAPREIVVPEGVEIIGAGACEFGRVEEIILPKSVYLICYRAFNGSFLRKINLENVKIIEDHAFQGCRLTEIGDIGAEKIGKAAFLYCEIKSVRLLNVKEIGDEAFFELEEGAEIYLPEGLEKIGKNAFCGTINSLRWILLRDSGMDNSVLYNGFPEYSVFGFDTLVKVLSPENDEVKFAIKIFRAEKTDAVNNSERYINSLFGGVNLFDFESYDAYFGLVCNSNGLRSKYEAAHYRIKYPAGLTDKARKMYIDYLENNAASVIWEIMDKPVFRVGDIADFPYLDKVKESDLMEIIDESVKLGFTELTAFLMNYKHERFPNSTHFDGEL